MKILLYILNDYAKIGGRFEASIPALESVLNNCDNDEEFINAVFNTLSIIGKSVKLPKGSAKLCEAQSKKTGHGPWSKYITSAIGNSDLSEEDDKVAFNNYMKSEMNEKERWSKGYVSIFCDAANKNSYTEAASLCSEL